jgi:hypothetical protein
MALAADPNGDTRTLRHAAILLSQASAFPELAGVARRYFDNARRRGDRRPLRSLALELVGDEAADGAREAVLRAYSVGDRIRASRLGRAVVPVSLAFGVAGIAAGAYFAGRPPAVPPDAVIVVLARDASGANFVLTSPIRNADWIPAVPLVAEPDARTINAGQQLNEFVPRPGHPDEWVMQADVPDSGGTELFVLTDGGRTRRRLTFKRSSARPRFLMRRVQTRSPATDERTYIQ